MKKQILYAGAALVMFCMTGCQDTVNTIENQEKNAISQIVEDKRFVTDSFLKNRLRLQGVKTARTPSGNMTVEVAALNRRTGFYAEFWSHLTGEVPYPVEYKFEWMDQNGMRVSSHVSGIWQRITIRPGETAYFRATAPTPRCCDFVLSVKETK